MYTDWLVVRRLADELERALRGARVRDVGVTPDGRFALRVRARGAGGDALVIDAFGDTPAITLEHEVEIAAAPGWPRAVADAISGMRVERIRSRRGDRLIALDVATVSRFGVLSSYRVVAELVPRYGNVLLLKGDAIVAAAREFTALQNPRRPIAVGDSYQAPPLQTISGGAAELRAALQLRAAEPSAKNQTATVRALRAAVPLLPQLIAGSLLAASSGNVASAEELIERAQQLVADAELQPDALAPIYVYMNEGCIVQAHVVPLAQFAHLTLERRDGMLEVLGEALEHDRATRGARDGEGRRRSLISRLERRREKLRAERESLQKSLADEPPERLRDEGNLLYAHHTEVPPGATVFVTPSDPPITISLDPELDAKANAAAIFKRYRKAVGRRNHAERRSTELDTQLAAAEELAWEVERADVTALEELSDDVDTLEHAGRKLHARTQQRRSALEVSLADDARVLVGRSPKNNAELTFRIARPDDLWFHARGVPGAHVVLRIDTARAATNAEVQSAAELAAYHSKARTSGIVPVDYTRRKYVRKQQNALPGLVWYTNAKTIDVTPRPAGSPL